MWPRTGRPSPPLPFPIGMNWPLYFKQPARNRGCRSGSRGHPPAVSPEHGFPGNSGADPIAPGNGLADRSRRIGWNHCSASGANGIGQVDHRGRGLVQRGQPQPSGSLRGEKHQCPAKCRLPGNPWVESTGPPKSKFLMVLSGKRSSLSSLRSAGGGRRPGYHASRFALEQACKNAEVPLVHGRWQGSADNLP